MEKKLFNINGQKSKIGFTHGFTCIVGGIILAYLTMMLFSKFMPGDYGVKIVPSIILTPILICVFGLWLLFSKTIFQSLLKFIIPSIILFIIIKGF